MTVSAAPPKTVILWVHPRSTSTMFEQALLSQGKLRVLHEPLGDPWYFGQERVSKRFSDDEVRNEHGDFKASTFGAVWDEMVSPQDGAHERTFSKDMAQYIFPLKDGPKPTIASLGGASDNDSLVPSPRLFAPSLSHTFLIRHPRKAVPSYYRLCTGDKAAETGFLYFDPSEAGYTELRQLFDMVKAQRAQQGLPPPLLIESEDLLKNPEAYMQLWCDEVKIPFEKSMLSWDEGQQEHFKKWKGFHSAAENSRGIGQGLKKEHTTQEQAELPAAVSQCIEDCMPDYEYLQQFATKLE